MPREHHPSLARWQDPLFGRGGSSAGGWSAIRHRPLPWLGAGVRATSRIHYPGDRVDALIQYVEDADQPLRDRDRAVWAPGQLGDRRALRFLREYYSGEPGHHAGDATGRCGPGGGDVGEHAEPTADRHETTRNSNQR